MFDLQQNWDERVGLWRSDRPGHTAEMADLTVLHSGPLSSSALVGAALSDRLDQVDISRVLRVLRDMQAGLDTATPGCIKWYWQESKPNDTNAAFFTAMGLIPLYLVWGDSLSPDDRDVLTDILDGFEHWFMHEIQTRSMFYPNKFLGDLVCGWLLLEITGRHNTEQAHAALQTMTESADYWQHKGWGWGEHLSDGYAIVCLHELSMLLLLSRHLPQDVYARYQGLLNDLLSIEDAFNGQVRVPALRSYYRIHTPEIRSFRALIQEWNDSHLHKINNLPPLGTLWHKLNWQKIAASPKPVAPDITIPCFNDTQAVACVKDDMRLGTMSDFPVMPGSEHASWGLAWQCMPVALWANAGDWSYMQWEVCEDGKLLAHPGNEHPHGKMPKALTQTITPPITGRTRSLQYHGDALILRTMPAIAASWEKITDRFRLTNLSVKNYEIIENDGWSQLTLNYQHRTVSIACVDVVYLLHQVSRCANTTGRNSLKTSVNLPERVENQAGGFDWQLTYNAQQLQNRWTLTNLWAISLTGPITNPPQVTALPRGDMPREDQEMPVQLTWEFPNNTFTVGIDPKSNYGIKESQNS